MRSLVALGMMLAGGCDALVSPSRYTEVVVEAVRVGGAPVAGLNAILYTGQRTMGHAITDSSGRAVFTRVPEGPAYSVFVEAPDGYVLPESVFGGPPSDVAPAFAVLRDSVHVVRFTLLRLGSGSIEVDVRDDTGAPITGQKVSLYSPTSTFGTAVTDAEGIATFLAVPFGTYGVWIEPPVGYRDVDDPPFVYKDGVFVEEGSEVRVDFVLPRCVGSLDIVVNDQAGGPAAGLLVTLFDARIVRDTVRTNVTGRASFVTGCGEVGAFVSPGAGWKPVPGRNGEYVDGILIRRSSSVTASLLVERVP